MEKDRINHYYPAAILGVGYSSIFRKSDKRNLKVKYANISNLNKFITELKNKKLFEKENVLGQVLEKAQKDIIEKVPHTERILSEIACDKIFTNLNLIEDINDKKNEPKISKIEQSFLGFLSKTNLIYLTDQNNDHKLHTLVEDNYETIIDFIDLTINRTPCFDERIKKHFTKKLPTYNIHIVRDKNFVFSDLLPVVPLTILDFKEYIKFFPFLSEYDSNNDCNFKLDDKEIESCIKNDLLLFPVSKSFAFLLMDDPIVDLLHKDDLYLILFLQMYFSMSVAACHEFLVYDGNNENDILIEIIDAVSSDDDKLASLKKQLSEPYLSILHTKIKSII